VAIWQFRVALVPQSWIDSGGDVESLFGEQGFEAAVAWRGYQNEKLNECLSGVLSKGKSWQSDLTLFGKTDADDIQVWRKRGEVESIQVSFDLRNPNMPFFRVVAEVARQLRLTFVCLEGRRVLGSDTQRLLRAAAESDAAHFTLDPQSFLMQVDTANEKAT
jgi:hypothetical protein